MRRLMLAGAVMAAVGCASEPSAAVRVPASKTSEGPGEAALTPAPSGPSPLHPLVPTDEALATSTTTTVAPTTTTTEPAPATTTAAPRRAAPATTVYEVPAPQGRTTGRGSEPPAGDAPLACIRSYEGDYATNTGNGYYGAYQFDLPTWRSVGGSGLPSNASPAEQDMRAQMLYDRRGLAPWPTPNRMCQ